MKGRRQVKEAFLCFETIETWIVYVCHSEGEWARHKNVSAFERGMVVGARSTGCGKHWSGKHWSQLWEALESTWASIRVELF